MATTNNSSNQHITQYNTQVGGANNLLANVAPGVAGQVLTSNGPSAAPTYQAASGGSGGWVVIQSITASSSANIQFTSGITNTYPTYVIILNNIVPANTNNFLVMTVSTNGGSSFLSTGYQSGFIYTSFSGATFTNVNSTTTMLTTGANQMVTNGANNGVCGTLWLSGLATSTPPAMWGTLYYWGSGTQPAFGQVLAINTTTSGVNALNFNFNSGNIASGTITLYGIPA